MAAEEAEQAAVVGATAFEAAEPARADAPVAMDVVEVEEEALVAAAAAAAPSRGASMGALLLGGARWRALPAASRRLVAGLLTVRGQGLAAAVLDEAHLIISWGKEFRRAMLEHAAMMRGGHGGGGGKRALLSAVPVLAATATATTPARDEICARLALCARDGTGPPHRLSLSPFRHNIVISVAQQQGGGSGSGGGESGGDDADTHDDDDDAVADDDDERVETTTTTRAVDALVAALAGGGRGVGSSPTADAEETRPPPSLVFAHARREAERVAAALADRRFEAAHLHSEVGTARREAIAAAFADDALDVLVATSIAEQGVDHPRLDATFSLRLPRSAEGWLQQAGRGGRNGQWSSHIVIDTTAVSRRRNGGGGGGGGGGGAEGATAKGMMTPAAAAAQEARQVHSAAVAAHAGISNCLCRHSLLMRPLVGASPETACDGHACCGLAALARGEALATGAACDVCCGGFCGTCAPRVKEATAAASVITGMGGGGSDGGGGGGGGGTGTGTGTGGKAQQQPPPPHLLRALARTCSSSLAQSPRSRPRPAAARGGRRRRRLVGGRGGDAAAPADGGARRKRRGRRAALWRVRRRARRAERGRGARHTAARAPRRRARPAGRLLVWARPPAR